MPTPHHEHCWWIEHNGSTHIVAAERQLPTTPVLAMGKVYPDSRSGVITHINNAPARMELVSSQLLDALHARFPGTRWWIKDPTPAPQPRASTAS